MSDSITVSRKMLQLVFDTAVNSIDFSSGFLDDEEVVDGLRACAVVLGVDPMVGTPERFRCKFEGHHVAAHPQSAAPWRCPRCLGVLDPDVPREVEVSRDFDAYKYQVTMAQFIANARESHRGDRGRYRLSDRRERVLQKRAQRGRATRIA